MSLAGDPRYPRRNIYGGLLIAVLGALQVGLALPVLYAPERSWSRLLLLVASIALVFAGVAQVRLGLEHLHSAKAEPRDPRPGA